MATIGTTGTTSPTPYESRTTSPIGETTWARWVNIALGAWLFISAFIWPHTASSMTNTWIVGVAIVIAAVLAMFIPWFRWVNTAIAIYLFISVFAYPHVARGTVWNNALVAIAVFLVSLVPGTAHTTAGRRLAHTS